MFINKKIEKRRSKEKEKQPLKEKERRYNTA